MAENSAIEWTHHTFNPWIGCTKVGPGCDNCYAADLATVRLGVKWGAGAEHSGLISREKYNHICENIRARDAVRSAMA
ncbi:DUF5131 family protein [Novosphingobium sp. KA1]|uniref:DUF5131 family protein n=1 Tax=Novosphingobium sp. (strain KA1) TaxID=164608 RepID=UPI001A9031E9|nr:DUF5131 family protein [Novosphingobium sp. KA1]